MMAGLKMEGIGKLRGLKSEEPLYWKLRYLCKKQKLYYHGNCSCDPMTRRHPRVT